jgi:hypothetical protein
MRAGTIGFRFAGNAGAAGRAGLSAAPPAIRVLWGAGGGGRPCLHRPDLPTQGSKQGFLT